MPQTSAAMLRAIDKYNKSKDEIKVRLEKGQKEALKTYAQEHGESLNAFINRAIAETIQRDNA